MLQRTLTAAVGLPILAVAVWWSTPWLAILVVVIASLGIREFYRLPPPDIQPLPVALGVTWIICLVLGVQFASGSESFLIISGGILAAGGFAGVLWLLAYYSGDRPLVGALYLLGGLVYVGFLLVHSLALRDIGDTNEVGRNWLLLTLLTVFATDTGAYLSGRSFGRHPMAPSISPGKTWEGAAGGLGAAVAAVVVLGLAFDLDTPRWQLVIIGVTVGVIAQWGDLLESKLKRISNVKDAGSIIPGHGGVLDRLDSVVVSIPVVYYLLVTVFEP